MTLLICNEDLIPMYEELGKKTEKEYIIVSSEKELNHFIDKIDPNSIKYCFIHSDLTWDNKGKYARYGFEIAKKLRQVKIRCIFYFFPPVFKLQDEELKQSKFSLLQADYYHKLIDLEKFPEEIKNLSYELMSHDLLDDIINTLLSPRSLVREIIHRLKNKVSLSHEIPKTELEQKLTKAIEIIFDELFLVLNEKQKELESIKRRFTDKMLNKVATDGAGVTYKVVEDFTNEIINLAPAFDINQDEPEELPKTTWKVLFVDDEKNIRDNYEQAFKNNNISCIFASNVQDALDILKNDSRNLITVLVTDIRFQKETTNKWDQLQGYDLLRITRFELANIISMFAITAARKIIYRFKQNNQFRVHTYYKDDILSSAGAKNMFCQKIREEGDNTFFKSRNRPHLSSWNRMPTKTSNSSEDPKSNRFAAPLSYYYRSHLFSLDYHDADEKINQTSKEYAEALLEGKIDELELINFTGTLKSYNPNSPEGLDKFRFQILTGRRIALVLYCHHKIKVDQIFKLMQPSKDDTETRDIEAGKKQLFNTSLALSFSKDLPKKEKTKYGYFTKSNLLIEEVEWLINEYDCDFNYSQIQNDKKELDIIINILDDIMYTLKIKGKVKDDKNIIKLQEVFLKKDLQKLDSIKKVISLFPSLEKILAYHRNKIKINAVDDDDLNIIQNKEIKDFLSKIIKRQI